MSLIAVYLIAVVLFILILISLGFQPKFIARSSGALLFITGVLGTLFYGYGYHTLYESVSQAAMRTLFSVFCMFLGRNEISAIASTPLLQAPAMQILLYFTHLLALYCTASAVVQTIGTRLIRTLHLLLVRRGHLHVIYGANEDSVSFAEKLLRQKAGTVILIDDGGGSGLDGRILRMGSLLLADEDAKSGGAALLRKLGMKPGNRKLTLYCLSRDPEKNLRFARALQTTLLEGGIHPAQTALTALLSQASQSPALQAQEGRYGFGSVNAIEPADLVGRLTVKALPPYRTMTFDEAGLAKTDFDALVVGFGLTGQAVLRQLILNGQFAGSRFHATVVARDPWQQAGSFFARSPGLQDAYDIEFLDADARSIDLYRRLMERGDSLKYAVLCTGSDKENEEIARALTDLFRQRGLQPALLQCTAEGVRKAQDAFGPAAFMSLYAPEILCSDQLDAMAKILNHQYHLLDGRTPEEDWKACDYFSRMSCRAAADYVPALLAAAGVSEADAREKGLSLTEIQARTLGEAEHLRWCAFHYVSGYRPMPEEVWRERAARYRAEAAQGGKGALRIGKDTLQRLHACLIPWEELDNLSAREAAVTGKPVDYRQMDLDNVAMIPAMLRAIEKGA